MVKGGSIIEKGSHDELIANPEGHYSALWKLQQSAPTKEAPSFEVLQVSVRVVPGAHKMCKIRMLCSRKRILQMLVTAQGVLTFVNLMCA